MSRNGTSANRVVSLVLPPALEEMTASFERFRLLAGVDTLGRLMEWDATALCGPRHGRGAERQAHRWGRTKGRLGFHGGRIEIPRPRVRGRDGKEDVKRWRDASMALGWTVAAMLEAAKGFRRLKAKSRLPRLNAALLAHRRMSARAPALAQSPHAA